MPATATDDAFLGTILEHPDDDAPRLVYADWLDEQGDADRAEFIRLQVQAARMAPDDPAGPDVRRRLHALSRERHVEWVNRLPELEGVHWEVFDRGFISTARFDSPEAFFEHARAVFEAAPIREVRLHQFLHTHATRMAGVRHLRRVRTLDLNDGNRVGNQGLEDLMKSPHLAGLTALKLGSNSLGSAGVRAIAHSTYVRNLRLLKLERNDLYDGLGYLAAAPALRQLQVLDLSWTRTGDDGVKALAGSRHLTGLRWLDLSHNPLTDPGVVALAGSGVLAELRALFLHGNNVTDAAAEALARSPQLGGLEYLFLQRTQVRDAGALALARSPHLRRLRELFLGDNRISDLAGAELRARFGAGVSLS